MKKSFKKYLSIYLSIFIIILNCVPIVSHAAGEFSLQTGKGWVYSEENDLPTGHNVYFQFATGKAWYTSDVNLALQLANRQGLIINPTSVNGVFSTLWDYLVTNADAGGYYKVYKGETVVGIAVNDLSGCTLNNHTGTGGTFDVPSGLNNTVHNYLDEQTAVEMPDYISLPTITSNLATPNLDTTNPKYNEILQLINNPLSTYIFNCQNSYDSSYYTTFNTGTSGQPISKNTVGTYKYNNDFSFCMFSSSSSFDSFCNEFALTSTKNVIGYSDFRTHTYVNSSYIYTYNSSGTRINCNTYSLSGSDYGADNGWFKIYNYTDCCILPFSNNGWFTIYRDGTTVNQINNNVYAPKYRITKNFMDYDNTSTTNVTTVNTNNIDNSQQNNETIYNNSNTEINQNMTENNYTYNTDSSTTIINNIVNNYYSDDSGDEGGGDSGDDSGDGILDTLLDALLGFFRAIGKIIATILTGVVEILTSVLEAIGNITEDFTGITDFLSSFFSFLPEPIISVLVLGVTISVLWAMICMFKK